MAGPARVAWVDHALDTGGAERSLMELLPLLDRDRYAPVLLHSADAVWATSPGLAEMPRVPVFGASALLDASRGEVQAGLWASRQQLGAAGGPVRALWRALGACRADIIHTNTLKCSLLASAAVRLPRRRLIWHVRDIITEPAARRWMLAACRAANPYVIAISRAVAEQFEPLSEKLRLRVIYNGVPLDRFSPGAPPAELRPGLGLQADDEVVTVVGRLTPWKGHRTLLRAMAAVTTRHPRARLLVVGQVADREREYLADLESLAAQLGISGVTRFVGYRDDVPDLLRLSQIVVSPSTCEPFGRALVEAMAVGKPVIGTRSGGTPEVITEGQSGLLVTPGDDAELSAAISRLLGDRELAAGLGDAAWRRANRHFCLQRVVREVEEVYAEVLAD